MDNEIAINSIYDEICENAKRQINPKLYTAQKLEQSEFSALQENQFDKMFNSNFALSLAHQKKDSFDPQSLEIKKYKKQKPVPKNYAISKKIHETPDLTIRPNICMVKQRHKSYILDGSVYSQKQSQFSEVFQLQKSMIFGDMHKQVE